MVKILHLSDIHMGSGFVHGRPDPETGVNSRLRDFERTLSRCLDRAIAEPADLVLFGGDAFPDATPPPAIQEAFARQFRRLADADIPTVLLVGNHDQHAQGQGGASLNIYRTLGVPGFVVGDRLKTHRLETRDGPVQVTTLPWLARSTLLTRPDAEGLSTVEVGHLLIDRLRAALEGEIRQLDPDLPAILLAHVMSDTARLGAERFLGVGKGFAVPLSVLARPEYDYVALGHVHCHQNLNGDRHPPTVYPGSIERVDFSEEKEEKGFVWVEIVPIGTAGDSGDRAVGAGEPDGSGACEDGPNRTRGDSPPETLSPISCADASRTETLCERERPRETRWQFCPLPARPFRTLKVDLSSAEDPQATLLGAIDPETIREVVVRVIYRLRPEQLEAIDLAALGERLAAAHSYAIHAELTSQLARPRLPDLDVRASADPLEALRAYLDSRPDLEGLAGEMMRAAAELLGGREEEDDPEASAASSPASEAGEASGTTNAPESAAPETPAIAPEVPSESDPTPRTGERPGEFAAGGKRDADGSNGQLRLL